MGIISLDPEQYQEIAQKDLKHVIPRSITIASVHPHTLSYSRTVHSCILSIHHINTASKPTFLTHYLILPSQCILILKSPTLSTHPLNPLLQTTLTTHYLRYLPMLVPPKRWDNKKTRDGCYFRLKSSIVRSNSRMQIEAVRRANIGPVLEGLDYLGQVMCLGYQWTTPFYHVPLPPLPLYSIRLFTSDIHLLSHIVSSTLFHACIDVPSSYP